ncbi:protein brown [Armigeres subalbatus]|uniref:protein brown n=1 Tax=Armigeres subalbatus TaxID=124917 RepID=UPI002ED45260
MELNDRFDAGPGEPNVLLEWKSLSVRVGGQRPWSKTEQKDILKNATGAVRSGDLVAVMGASGSGKTTLLAAVSMRLVAKVDGNVLINGLNVTQSQMKRLSGFVPQFEIAIKSLTVMEHLLFVSKLKGLDRHRMVEVIKELNLDKCEHTRISNLSGGERKKVNLAGELLTEPDILFCDEPTTGLDSFNALAVLKTLKKIAFKGRKAVICTIHHPTSEAFQCFTDVVLVKNGEICYQGPTEEARTFFRSVHFPLPINCNPADHYFKLVCDYSQIDHMENDDHHLQQQQQQHHQSEQQRETDSQTRRYEILHKCHMENIVKKCMMGPYHQNDVIDKLCRNNHHACWSSQLYLLVRRGVIDSVRNIRQHAIVTLLFLITSITISALYFPVKPTSQTAIQDIRGALFLMICELLYTISYAVFYEFPHEMPLLRREVGEQMYRLSAYYAHKVLLTVPKAIFDSYLFIGIIYGCVQFSTGFATYVGISAVCTVASLLAVAYGYLFTCVTGSLEMSIEAANLIFLLYNLLGGLYLNVVAFPISKYLSFFFFASEGASIYYWQGVQNITCDRGRNTTCLRNGEAVLLDYGYGTTLDTVYFNYLVMAGEILVIHFAAYLCLRRFVRRVGFY